jgi:hypothetical protein
MRFHRSTSRRAGAAAFFCFALLLLLLLLPLPAAAAGPASFALAAGQAEVLNGGDGADLGIELRLPPRRFAFLPEWAPEIRPIGGVSATTEDALHIYAGFRVELPLGRRWLAAPSWAAGIYRQGRDKELGGPLEFRSTFELAWLLREGTTLGLELYHLSNGGLYELNPGTEALRLVISSRF